MTTNYKELIRNLRIRMEESSNKLSSLEQFDNKTAAKNALWIAYYAWCGKEYSAIETAVKEDESKGLKE